MADDLLPEEGDQATAATAGEPTSEARPGPSPDEPEELRTSRMTRAEQESVIWAARQRATAIARGSEGDRPQQSHIGLWIVASLSLLVALASMALNLVLLQQLVERRAQLREALAEASAGLDSVSAQGLSFDFPISETIDFVGDIPIRQELTFPVQTTITVNTVVSVPVDLGALGTINIDVPINTSVPVDTAVPVSIDETFHIETQVPIEMTVPVRLPADQPPLSDLIAQARAMLDRLAAVIG